MNVPIKCYFCSKKLIETDDYLFCESSYKYRGAFVSSDIKFSHCEYYFNNQSLYLYFESLQLWLWAYQSDNKNYKINISNSNYSKTYCEFESNLNVLDTPYDELIKKIKTWLTFL